MSGKDKDRYRNQMISFRVSPMERRDLEARIKVSGLKRAQFIIRSCLTSKVAVVGKKEQVDRIRDEIKQMEGKIQEIFRQIKNDEVLISKNEIEAVRKEYECLLKAILWLLEGGKYLWEDV